MNKDVQQLERQAEGSGFDVAKTKKGHTRFRAPNGVTVIGPGTPSDHRSIANTAARLKRAGLAEQAAKRQATSTSLQGSSAMVAVLEYLQAHAGRVFSVAEIVEAVQRQRNHVTAALNALKNNTPEVTSPDRGKWVYAPIARPQLAPEPEPEQEPVRKRRPAGEAASIITNYLREYPHQPLTPKRLATALDLPATTVAITLSNMIGRVPELFRISRGVYAWRPTSIPEDVRLRSRLRLLERELRDPQTGAVAHNLLLAERSQIEAKLEALANGHGNDNPSEQAPSEPAPQPGPVAVEQLAVATRPITVMPTALPADCPSLFEAVTVHPRSGTILLRDQNGEIWAATPVRIEIPEIAVANGGN